MNDEGFEPTKWWRAMKNGELLAETSSPSDFKNLGLTSDPEVTYERLHERIEQRWISVDAPPDKPRTPQDQ